MNDKIKRTVTFIQYDIPPLKSGEYEITVEQTTNQGSPDKFTTTKSFAVAGERFSFQSGEIHSVFPKNLANGEFEGVLPHVVFSRRTLPWERTSIESKEEAPWLAVLLFDESEKPTFVNMTAKDLIKQGEAITVAGSTITGTGTMPANIISYPRINPLDYGELPDDQCTVTDIPVSLFAKIAPSAEDLPYLAHIREVDTTDSEDGIEKTKQYAIVLSNRIPLNNSISYACLVSLENMEDYLPSSDGTPSSKIPDGTEAIRLVAFCSWSFTANTMNESFKGLLENLNKNPDGTKGLTSLQFPFAGQAPSSQQVELALNHQANAQLTDEDAEVLVQNAFTMGYVSLNHHLRHAGNTVSWYRSPLVAYPVKTEITIPISCPDEANRYNPQTGMFDVSYGAAWQLGQLLALQNKGFSTALYNWKKTQSQSTVIAEEQDIINKKLKGANILESFLAPRRAVASNSIPPVPEDIAYWLGRLKLLYGVPFNYLVPCEDMLPPESMRFFYMDMNWIDSLIDGAFSIGRATTGELEQDAITVGIMKSMALQASRQIRPNPRPQINYCNDTHETTGFLLRSQVVSGWPKLNVNGYSDFEGSTEIPKLRMSRISDQVLLCLFDGVVNMVAIHEPPEQLHSGVEKNNGKFTTTLREVNGDKPGMQYLSDPKEGSPDAEMSLREDGQTLRIKDSAQSIMTKLNNDFGEGLNLFTSAEFALELVKGVIKVEFQNTDKG